MFVRRALLSAALSMTLAAPALSAPVPLSGATTVALDPASVDVLVGLGLSVAPIAPGTLVGLDATFPISGGEEQAGTLTRIFHVGGLSFSAGPTVVDLENFIIDLPQLTLFGFVNGGDDEVPLFAIDGATLGLSLTDVAAGALNTAFGTDALQGGIPIGVASVNVTVPEPATLLLMGGALGSILLRRRRRS